MFGARTVFEENMTHHYSLLRLAISPLRLRVEPTQLTERILHSQHWHVGSWSLMCILLKTMSQTIHYVLHSNLTTFTRLVPELHHVTAGSNIHTNKSISSMAMSRISMRLSLSRALFALWGWAWNVHWHNSVSKLWSVQTISSRLMLGGCRSVLTSTSMYTATWT